MTKRLLAGAAALALIGGATQAQVSSSVTTGSGMGTSIQVNPGGGLSGSTTLGTVAPSTSVQTGPGVSSGVTTYGSGSSSSSSSGVSTYGHGGTGGSASSSVSGSGTTSSGVTTLGDGSVIIWSR